MAVSTGSSKDSWSSLQGTKIVGRHEGPGQSLPVHSPKSTKCGTQEMDSPSLSFLKSQDSTRLPTTSLPTHTIKCHLARKVIPGTGTLWMAPCMGGAARGSAPRRGWSAAPLPAAPEALGGV